MSDQAGSAFGRIRMDTFIGMGVSNLVALCIILGTATTLHAAGKTDIQSAADAARALQPAAGKLAALVFNLGLLGTGLLWMPVFAGSSAYAASDAAGWTASLERKPHRAKAFYGVIAAGMILGMVLGCSPINPMKAPVWSSVINGVAAVPVLVGLMIAVSRRDIMGKFAASSMLRVGGWFTTGIMAAAALAMACTGAGSF